MGEDTLLHCSVGEYSANVEVARAVDGDACPCESCSCDRRGVLIERKGIEVGHIFHLGTKYSSAMGATYQARDGSRVPISMGCYGIGITRVVAAIIEAGCEAFGEDAFVWPDAVAPYECLLLPPQSSKDKETPEADAMRAAYESMPDKSRIVFDDRFDTSKKIKLEEIPLVGYPTVVACRDGGGFEVHDRRSGVRTEISDLTVFLNA